METADSKNQKQIGSNYFPKGGYKIIAKLDPIARVLLCGVYDDDHELSAFRGMRYLVEKIHSFVIQFNRHHFSKFIKAQREPVLTSDANKYRNMVHYDAYRARTTTAFQCIERHRVCHPPRNYGGGDYDYYSNLAFPAPQKEEINVNMMPLKMEPNELKTQLAEHLHAYIPWILACLYADTGQRGTICYLTIHESFVQKGHSQRRPGLHVEYPGKKSLRDLGDAYWFHGWGGGYEHRDGIYMASNIDDSCAVWNCSIKEVDGNENDEDEEHDDLEDGIRKLGDIEHLRHVLPMETKHMLKAGKLYWITDRTPHEALPMQQDGWRQFFRLVSHKLGVWYEQHSTKNPLGVLPDPEYTRVIKTNKFADK